MYLCEFHFTCVGELLDKIQNRERYNCFKGDTLHYKDVFKFNHKFHGLKQPYHIKQGIRVLETNLILLHKSWKLCPLAIALFKNYKILFDAFLGNPISKIERRE